MGDVEGMSIAAHTLAAHLEATEPHIPQRQQTQTEQFVDAPPKDVYVSDWREHVKRKQKQEKHNGK